MPRPCTCNRIPPLGEAYSDKYCRLCHLFHNDPRYRALWDNLDVPVSLPPQPIPVADGPGWFQKAVNFSKAAVKHVWNGLPSTPTAEQERRIGICLACDLLDAASGTCKHAACGCSVARKVGWLDAHCPLAKW